MRIANKRGSKNEYFTLSKERASLKPVIVLLRDRAIAHFILFLKV